MSVGTVVVYGGAGGLGRSIVQFFKEKAYQVINIDLVDNNDADKNIVVPGNKSMVDQGEFLKQDLSSQGVQDKSLDAIFCVAGGWAGGNAKADTFLKSSDDMFKQSVESSFIAAHLATRYLKPNGLLTLTGAYAAIGATPGMIGYGVAKAAVHHLTQNLAQSDGGLPDGSRVACICPVTIDTPMNRKNMPNADTSTWTPTKDIAEQLYGYLTGKKQLGNGKLVAVTTSNGNTSFREI